MDINISNPVTNSKIGEVVNASTAATPNNTDLVATVESSVLKKITWTNVKAFLKTYFDTIYQATGSYLTSANIDENITNGVTDKAPSQNAVFDALALKASRSTKTYMFANLGSPLDAQSYLCCDNPIAALNTSETVRRFKFGYAGTLKEVSLNLNQVNNASGETVTVYLRNISTGTDNLVGTFTSDFGASTSAGFVWTGLNITINSSDYYAVKILTPTWSSNPSSWSGGGSLLIL